MVLPGRMSISPNPFHGREALPYRLRVGSEMAGQHLPDEGRDAPLLPGGESLEGFILPIFKHNVGLMHIFSPWRSVSRGSPDIPECQEGIGLAMLPALTIVAQDGGPNKGLQATANSVRSSLAPAVRRA
jgi:hypothetical protein